MLKGDVIKGYKVLKDFTTAGGGLSKWTFASKGGKEYFLKEFLSPKYPTKNAPGSPKSKERKRLACEKFEKHHMALMKEINEKCGSGGNLVFTVDFFRNESKYYKVTEKVDVASLSIAEIADLPLSKRILILKTITHSLNVLHGADIVHGDLKPDNILIKQTKTDSYTAKLIDFDNSYFSENPPEISEELVGDMVFYSPELALYIKEDPRVDQKDLTIKSDVFALGLIFGLYLTGKLPDFDQEKYTYACIASNAGEDISLGDDVDLPDDLKSLINRMLANDYHQRPGGREVFEKLKVLDLSAYAGEEEVSPTVKMNLKGGLAIKSKSKMSVGKKAPSGSEHKSSEENKENPKSGLRGKGLGIIKK